MANGYLQSLVREGLVDAEGTTRARIYRLKTLTEAARRYPREGLQEDLVWRELIAPVVARLPQNVRDIWHYAATEMINNAIDHSGAAEVQVSVRKNALCTEAVVADEGEGIFLKIQRALELHDPREAILELAKGKLTTAPSGIRARASSSPRGRWISSRSNRTTCASATRRGRRLHRRAGGDTPGTRVRMRLANDSPRLLREVFDAFTGPEEFRFDRTVVPLRLAQYEGEKLVSRSQAKRVAHRFERFKRGSWTSLGSPRSARRSRTSCSGCSRRRIRRSASRRSIPSRRWRR